MIKKLLLILLTITVLPVFADYNPLSDEPINNTEEFYQNEAETQPPEFEYPTSSGAQTPPNVEIKSTKNYVKIYNDLAPADFSYIHNMDPEQYYDMKDATWSPYPLLRLNSAIFFKNITIEPGYYLLTPREHKGKWFLLFKQNGLVKYIVPVYERGITPEFFYDKHLPKPKEKFAQKIHKGTLSAFGKLKSSKRKDPIKCYMEINDLENYFVSIVIYYGNHKYSTIMRTIKL